MNNQDRQIYNELIKIIKKTTKVEKHRGYHLLPERLNTKIEDEELKSKFVFYERERLTYFKSKINFSNKSFLDIGCNTGYFLFEYLDLGAKQVTGYEGKILCGEFIKKAIELFNEKDRFIFYNKYFDFHQINEQYDNISLLNVLHHVGDDYGDKSLNIENALSKISEQINGLANNTSTLIYQMGFNWQGNVNHSLFKNGTKSEMIEFMRKETYKYWNIIAIGIPERENNKVVYNDLNENNIERDDSLGEFLNRPIFILERK